MIVTKHRSGIFTIEVHNLFRYTGLSTMGHSLAGVLDATVFELGTSVHEVGNIRVVANTGAQLDSDEGDYGKFFTGYLSLDAEQEGEQRIYSNSRCWAI